MKIAHKFKLGTLMTETPHDLTKDLSNECQNDLKTAIASLKAVDTDALQKLSAYTSGIADLGKDIKDTVEAGNKVYLVGCGATGRLSISLEVFNREGALLGPEYQDRFIGFMAGGDAALIKSIENFEDRPQYAHRQLEELGFTEGDLLIASTEGGETSFVIGATERATELCKSRKPWFLYCNPTDQLVKEVERSANVINNEGIINLCLYTGPMGISGSTRM